MLRAGHSCTGIARTTEAAWGLSLPTTQEHGRCIHTPFSSYPSSEEVAQEEAREGRGRSIQTAEAKGWWEEFHL